MQTSSRFSTRRKLVALVWRLIGIAATTAAEASATAERVSIDDVGRNRGT